MRTVESTWDEQFECIGVVVRKYAMSLRLEMKEISLPLYTVGTSLKPPVESAASIGSRFTAGIDLFTMT